MCLHRLLGLPIRHPLLDTTRGCVELRPQTAVDRLWAACISAAPQDRNRECRIEIRISLSLSRPGKPVQFGVFVARSIDFDPARPSRVLCPAGSLVTAYGGLLRHRCDIEQTAAALSLSLQQAKSHARRVPGHDYACDGLPLAWMLRRPIPRDWFEPMSLASADITQFLPTSPQFTAAEIALFDRSPVGFMCNTACAAAGERNNIRIEYRTVSLGGGLSLELPILIATDDLREGDELLSPYRNVASTSGHFD